MVKIKSNKTHLFSNERLPNCSFNLIYSFGNSEIEHPYLTFCKMWLITFKCVVHTSWYLKFGIQTNNAAFIYFHVVN